jgi:hypothetical protein
MLKCIRSKYWHRKSKPATRMELMFTGGEFNRDTGDGDASAVINMNGMFTDASVF